jgi:hypothetical protein
MDRSHPDFAVLVMSLGMVAILLDVTVKVHHTHIPHPKQ